MPTYYLTTEHASIPIDGLQLSDEERMLDQGSTWYGAPLAVLTKLWGRGDEVDTNIESHKTHSGSVTSDDEKDVVVEEFETYAMKLNDETGRLEKWLVDGVIRILLDRIVMINKETSEIKATCLITNILGIKAINSVNGIKNVRIHMNLTSEASSIFPDMLYFGFETDTQCQLFLTKITNLTYMITSLYRHQSQDTITPLEPIQDMKCSVFAGDADGKWIQETDNTTFLSIRSMNNNTYLCLSDVTFEPKDGYCKMIVIDEDFLLQVENHEAKCLGHLYGMGSPQERSVFGFSLDTANNDATEIERLWIVIWCIKGLIDGLEAPMDATPPFVAPILPSSKQTDFLEDSGSASTSPHRARFSLVVDHQHMQEESEERSSSEDDEASSDSRYTSLWRRIAPDGWSKPHSTKASRFRTSPRVCGMTDEDNVPIESPNRGFHNQFLETTHFGTSLVFQRNAAQGASKLSYYTNGAMAVGEDLVHKDINLNPRTAVLSGSESKVVLSDETNQQSVYLYDIEKAKVISSMASDLKITQLAEKMYGASQTDESTVLALNNQAVFQFDTRGKGNSGPAFQYVKDRTLACLNSNAQGNFATGSLDGHLRLFDGRVNEQGNLLRCKTDLHVGHSINDVHTTRDGHWALATGQDHISLYPLFMDAFGRNGFEKTMGELKATPITLHVPMDAMVKFGLKGQFRRARFSEDENAIVSFISNLVITWDFVQIQKKMGATKPHLHLTSRPVIDVQIRSVGDKPSKIVYIFDRGIEEVSLVRENK